MDPLLLYAVQVDEIVYRLDSIWLDIVLIHVTKITRKILSDRNICIVLLFYRLHGDIVHIVIVTTIGIVNVTV